VVTIEVSSAKVAVRAPMSLEGLLYRVGIRVGLIHYLVVLRNV
jgi:hypothetical protein